MKKYPAVLIYLVITTLSFLFTIQTAYGQVHFTGKWEGIFMNDFLARIDFGVNNENLYEGNLTMFAGNDLIQDDKIVDIQLLNKKITFYIPDKETLFEGSFDDLISELSGEFIFPDGSRHAIQLKRKMAEATTAEEFRLLKEKKISVQELRSDLLFLYTSLKENHPQVDTSTSKDNFDPLFDKINRELNTALTLEEFYFQTAKLTNAVNCSHTGVRLPATYQNLVNEFGNFFPLKLFFSDGKAFYISGASAGDHQLAPGSEIMRINDKPVDEIIQRSFYYIPSEACNLTTKYNELNKRFNSLFYFLDDSGEFKVTFKSASSVRSIEVASANLADLNFDDGNGENGKLVDFSYIDNTSIGLLKVSSFAMRDMDQYFYRLDSIFSDLKSKKTSNLILDLRDNSGGLPIFAAQLFSYLTDKEFIYFKRNEDVKDFEPLYNTMQPNKLSFTGNLYVLVNGGCLSTTGHLISLLKFYTNAIFIGEEPGSTFRCNDFSMQLVLPNSGIQLNVPRTTFETSVTGFEVCEPFPLDFEIILNANDIIDKKDTYVEMAEAISKK